MSILARLFPSHAKIARLRAVNEILVARAICNEAHIERLNNEIDALHRDIAEMESDLFDSRDANLDLRARLAAAEARARRPASPRPPRCRWPASWAK